MPPRLLASLVLGGAMSAAFFACRRRRWPNWTFLLLGILPTLFVYGVNPGHRVYSFHGFLHLGVVYRVLCGALPPDNPTFAGAPLLYPWAYHVLAAALSRGLDVSPPWAFVGINLACLAATLTFLFRAAEQATGERNAALSAVLLSIFGLGFTSALDLSFLMLRRFGVFLEFRGLPPAAYFTEIQADGAGLACYSLALLSLVRFLGKPANASGRAALGGLCAALVGAGLLYPFYFVAAFLSAVVTLGLPAARRRLSNAEAAIAFGVVVAAALVAAPYLLSLVAEKAPAAQIRPAPSIAYVARKLAMFLALIGPFGLLMLSRRAALLATWRARPFESWVLWVAAVVPSALYLLTEAPLSDEFKFQTVAVVGIGLVGATSLEDLARSRPWLAFLAATAFLVPMANHVLFTAFEVRTVADAFTEDGTAIVAADADQRALYDWIRHRSDCDAVFVDTGRTIPVFGQRSLYAGLDERRGPAMLDGWKISSHELLSFIHGYPGEEVDRRLEIARAFYADRNDSIEPEVLAAIENDIGKRPFYVVAREQPLRRRLDRDPRFEAVFEGAAGGIYLCRR